MLIAGPAGDLELAVTNSDAPTNKIAIICHPHPLYGGSMSNKVVTTLARAFAENGAIVIRFNFRGIGKSMGQYDHGKGEVNDLLAVVTWARQQYPSATIALGGFSFGAFIAATVAAQQTSVGQLILVAPPVNHFPFQSLQFAMPVVVAQGEQDEVVPASEVFAWAEHLQPAPTILRFPTSSHFFHGQLIALRDALSAVLQ